MSAERAATAIISKGEVSEKKATLAELETMLKKGQHFLIAKSQECTKLRVEIDALSIADKDLEAKLEEVLVLLLKHPMVEKSYYEDEWLVVETGKFTAYTQNDDAVPCPAMRIKLNLLNCDIIGLPLISGEGYYGYCSSARQGHPHYLAGGHPCLGDAACTITDLISDQEYHAAMLMLLEFTQNVNEEDSAGKYWYRWAHDDTDACDDDDEYDEDEYDEDDDEY